MKPSKKELVTAITEVLNESKVKTPWELQQKVEARIRTNAVDAKLAKMRKKAKANKKKAKKNRK